MTTRTPAELAGAAAAAGFSGQNLVIAVAVAMAESSGRDDATNHNTDGSTDYGAWQINSVHRDILAAGNWSNVNDNARMAYKVFAGSGWGAWTVYNTGAYAKYLGQAQQGAANAKQVTDPGGPQLPDIYTNPFGTGPPIVVPPGANPLPMLAEALKVAMQALGWLMNPANWQRIAQMMVGGVLLVSGLVVVVKPAVAPVISGAANVGKKVAKVAAVAAI